MVAWDLSATGTNSASVCTAVVIDPGMLPGGPPSGAAGGSFLGTLGSVSSASYSRPDCNCKYLARPVLEAGGVKGHEEWQCYKRLLHLSKSSMNEDTTNCTFSLVVL